MGVVARSQGSELMFRLRTNEPMSTRAIAPMRTSSVTALTGLHAPLLAVNL
jgi:hypothetical protein